MPRGRKPKTTDHRKVVIGYVRVSTDRQADRGISLSAQKAAIESECLRNGWELIEIIEDGGQSGKSLKRPGLQKALSMLAERKANVLMAAKLDRLSRSVSDVCQLGDMARHYNWNLSVLDARIDTTTPHGRAQLSMMATFAQLERELISARVKDAWAHKKAQGAKLGKPEIDDSTAAKIVALRDRGLSMAKIADTLNIEGVETARQGAKWYASTVRVVLQREAA